MAEFDLVLAALAIALGAIVQSISGVGGGFIIVPLLAMINVAYLPGPLVFATLSLSGLMSWRERAHIDTTNVWFIVFATLPGALVGAWVLAGVAPDRLGLVFGGVILLAVIISALGVHLALNRWTGAVAGFVAGAMGASSGIGAPVLAVLYQRESGPRVRSTLALLYTVASIIIVGALALFGEFDWQSVRTGFFLMPGFLLGYMVSRPLVLHFDHSATRYMVLAVSAIAAVTLILKSL